MEVLSIVEQDDGGAILTVDLTDDEVKAMVRDSILRALTDAVKRSDMEHLLKESKQE